MSFYIAEPLDNKNQIATSVYNDKKFCAMTVKNSNIIGTQLHPEKELKNWVGFLDNINLQHELIKEKFFYVWFNLKKSYFAQSKSVMSNQRLKVMN